MRKLFLHVLILAFDVLLLTLAQSTSTAAPTTLTYQGRIVQSNGTPLTYSSVSFIFQILNPAGNCVIYQEQVTGYNMTNSGGVFDVPIGSGSVNYPLGGGFTALDSFNNGNTFICGACVGYTCSNGTGTYNPVSSDGRLLRVQFYDGSGWKTVTPDNIIRSVPFAGYSASAEKLGTNIATDFLLKAGLPTCGANTFLSWNGAALSCQPVSGAAGGTVTNVSSANTDIAVATGTTTPVLTLNSGTGANQIVKLDGTGKLPAVNGSQLTNISSANLTGTVAVANGGTGLSSLGTANQVLGVNNAGTAAEYKTITAGTGITVAQSAGAITINATGGNAITALTGEVTATGPGPVAATIANNAVTTPKLFANPGINRLVATDSSTGATLAPLFCTAGQLLTWNTSTGWQCTNPSSVSSGSFSGSLSGDVTGTQSATVVAKVGTSTAANIQSAEVAANAATNANTASTIVKRDASGNFTAGTITANLTGAASLNVLKVGDSMTGNLNFAANTGNVYTAGSGANTATLQGPSGAIGTSYVLRLPTAQGAANQLMINDGSGNLSWSSLSSLGVASVSVTAPITNSGTASAPNIGIPQSSGTQNGYLSSADWTTFNNKQSTSLTSANIWVGSGANVATAVAPSGDVSMTNAGGFTVTGLRGKAISATAPSSSGQVLRYDGTSTYVPGFLGLADIRATITPFGGAFANSACTVGQSMYWRSSTDTFECQSIAINDGQLSFTTSRSANTFLAAPSGAAGAASFRTIASTDLPAGTLSGSGTAGYLPYYSAATTLANSPIYTTGGNVGIGTTSPQRQLHMANNGSTEFVLQDTSQAVDSKIWRVQNYTANLIFGAVNDAMISDTKVMTLTRTGNVGIGTTSPSAPLTVFGGGLFGNKSSFPSEFNTIETNTYFNSLYNNTATSGTFGATGSWMRVSPSANSTLNAQALSAGLSFNVPSGITVSGTNQGLWVNSSRNRYSGNFDNGTVSNLIGAQLTYGNENHVAGVTPQTTNAYGLYINPMVQSGTITNMYDIYLGTKATGGTVTNRFGIFQADNANNYFAGNVGIGTGAPAAKLDVAGSVQFGTNKGYLGYYNVGPYDQAEIGAIGASTSLSLVTSGVSRLNIAPSGNVGIGTTNPAYKLDVVGNSRVGSNSLPTTYNVAQAIIYTGVGTQYGIELRPTTAGSTIPIAFTNSAGAVQGSISIDGAGSTLYNTTSDYRLKENVVPLVNALSRIRQLEAKRFDYKADPRHRVIDGFIAHEVQKVIPEAVLGEKDATDENGKPIFQQLDLSKIVPLIAASVRELDKKVRDISSDDGHIMSRGGSAPSISSCGAGATISGTDNSFKVSVGSGTVTTCTINFGTAWTNAPNSCVFSAANTAMAGAISSPSYNPYVSSITTTQVSISAGASLASGVFYMQCF